MIGRFSVFRKALSEREIARLAKGEKSALTNRDGLVASLDKIAAGAILEQVSKEDLSKSASFECWIQPKQRSSTIFSKQVPGSFGSTLDGFGLELLPDGCLVFMMGAKMRGGATAVRSNNCLPAGRWSHVVVVTDGRTDTIRLYVDGRLADESTPSGGSAYTVSRAYALQRFIDACAGRGAHPIRFNGSLFTVPQTGATRKGEFPDPFIGPGDPDHNAWGPGYWWQNTRLPYQSMCAAGDYDLMQPFIRMYVEDIYPLSRYRTKTYTGQDGACFPEALYFWGSMFSLSWGWTPPYEKRTVKLPTPHYCKYIWVCGPELACMLFDYFDYTLDRKFLDGKLLPLAIDVLRFFDNHYRTVDGKLVMHPSQAVETWRDCTNPMPELAGLHALTRRVLALGEGLWVMLTGPSASGS
jgi:hypothetical protein